jgi:hypothetical protein
MGSPPKGEGTPGREYSDAEPPSVSLTRGHSGRHILSRNGSSLRRRQVELCNELHGELSSLRQSKIDRCHDLLT